jgi:transposase-like protein
MNLSQITAITETEARKYLENIRWGKEPTCPHCGSKEVTELQGKATTPGTWKCKAKECRKKFTVRVGTIFESSHISLRHWVMTFHLLCSSKKGMSAHQVHRSIGVTYKTAWFLCHRIRHAMDQGAGLLKGVVEADETYVGGKPRGSGKGHTGRGTKKAPVAALVERGGNVRAKVIERVTARNLREHVKANVDPNATLMTDEFQSYVSLGREFPRHGVINHGRRQYVNGDVYTNTVESFFALLKRGHYGTFHHLSKKHLHRYVNEIEFRWNHRKTEDGERRDAAIRGAEGKRLTYS